MLPPFERVPLHILGQEGGELAGPLLTLMFALIIISDLQHLEHPIPLHKKTKPLIQTAIQVLNIDLSLRVPVIGTHPMINPIQCQQMTIIIIQQFTTNPSQQINTEHGYKMFLSN